MLDINLSYLRKSREDIEYEKRCGNDESKTLQRHRERIKVISEMSNKPVLDSNIYEEVVSGDSIDERPVIQKILKLIENPRVRGVWVIDVQRLCRGDLGDQDRIIKAFKYTNTLILTPEKEYDLSKPADEEYLIDKLSYSRKEYNYIKKRLNEGRKDSVMAGLFIGSEPCYGMRKVKLQHEKGFVLEPIEEEAKILRMVGKRILEGKGTFANETYLDNLGIRTRKGKKFRKNFLRDLFRNWYLAGFTSWQVTKKILYYKDGEVKTKIIKQKLPECFKGESVDPKDLKDGEYLIRKARWKGIFSYEEFKAINDVLDKYSAKFVKSDANLQNPLAGLLRCSKCNLAMSRRLGVGTYWIPKKGKNRVTHYYPAKAIVACTNKCGTVSHVLEYVEELVIKGLKDWLLDNKKVIEEYNQNENKLLNEVTDKLSLIDKDIEKAKRKLDKIRDIYEDGEYSKETYEYRAGLVKANIEKLELNRIKINEENEYIKIKKIKELIPKVENCINVYFDLNVKEKNEILHSILEKIMYKKTKSKKESDISIDIYPRI